MGGDIAILALAAAIAYGLGRLARRRAGDGEPCELWDLETWNCLGTYRDEAEALAEVRRGAFADGRAAWLTVGLFDPARRGVGLHGAALLDRAGVPSSPWGAYVAVGPEGAEIDRDPSYLALVGRLKAAGVTRATITPRPATTEGGTP